MKGDECGATIKDHLVVVMMKKNLLSHTESISMEEVKKSVGVKFPS